MRLVKTYLDSFKPKQRHTLPSIALASSTLSTSKKEGSQLSTTIFFRITKSPKKSRKTFKRNWFSVLLFISIFFIYLFFPIDTDLGWHLRYGKHIFETGSVYRSNQIGFYLADYNWAHGYSLYQISTYALYHFFGLWGLIVGNGLVVSLIYFFTTRKIKTLCLKLSAIVFLYIGFISVMNLGLRSQIFTTLAISILLYELTKNRLALSNALTIPLLFILWANFHGGFVLGIAILFIFTLDKLFTSKKKEALLSGIVLSLSAFASLLNPFGIKLYLEAYRHSWYPLDKLIAEWVPPGNQSIFFILVTIAIIITTTGYQIIKGKFVRKKHNLFLLTVWIIFTYLSFSARRHLPLFAISSVFFAKNLIEDIPNLQKEYRLKIFSLIILTGLIGLRLVNLPDLKGDLRSLCQNSKRPYPCSAEKYLKNNPGICHNLFNTYEWGGHIAWQLPNRKTFIDGRMPVPGQLQTGKAPTQSGLK